jgi:pimeloyl-ACP methyl ester carboxylesterase
MARWLDETFAELGVPRAHLAGVSYGGWIALNEALRSPDQIASIALLDAVGLGPLDMTQFMLWGMCVFSSALAPSPIRRHIAAWTRMPLAEDGRMLRLMITGNFRHRLGTPQPHPLTDGELRSISPPMLALLAGRSEIYRSPSAVATRLKTLVPDAQVEITAGAGHALPVSHADLVIERLKRFLATQSPAAGSGTSRGA